MREEFIPMPVKDLTFSRNLAHIKAPWADYIELKQEWNGAWVYDKEAYNLNRRIK